MTSAANCCAASSEYVDGRALDDALELLDLLALHVLEARADALRRFDLFALDPLQQLALAPAHALVELVQRAPPLGRVRLDLARAPTASASSSAFSSSARMR